MRLKILSVEDNTIQVSILNKMLTQIGYEPARNCQSYDEAVAVLEKEDFDIALLDLHLDGEKDGVDVAKYIKNEIDIPVIFLTASSSFEVLNYVKGVGPSAFLQKPIRESQLFAAIEIAVNKERAKASPAMVPPVANNEYLFVKARDAYHKINFDDILYISSNHVYLTVHTLNRTYLVRGSLAEYALLLDPSRFIRVHRSHIINIQKVDVVDKNKVTIEGEEIHISKSYQKELIKMIGTRYSVLA